MRETDGNGTRFLPQQLRPSKATSAACRDMGNVQATGDATDVEPDQESECSVSGGGCRRRLDHQELEMLLALVIDSRMHHVARG
jgi:hypothetical protein